jgi:hypothetical protein
MQVLWVGLLPFREGRQATCRTGWPGWEGRARGGARDTGLALNISEFKRRDRLWSTDPCSPADVRRLVCDYLVCDYLVCDYLVCDYFRKPEGRLVHARLGPKLAVVSGLASEEDFALSLVRAFIPLFCRRRSGAD